MKIFLKYNNILYDNCMKMNFNMIVQFYKLNLFKIIQKWIINKNQIIDLDNYLILQKKKIFK